MKTLFVRSVAALSIVLLAACGSDEVGSAKLSKLEKGISLEAAANQLGAGPLIASGADTARVFHGYRRLRYFHDGVIYDVLYMREAPGDVKDPLLQAQETPIVFKEDKLMGTGWRFYVDEAMAKMGLPTPLRARDTMTVDSAEKAKEDTPTFQQDSTAAPQTPPATAPGGTPLQQG